MRAPGAPRRRPRLLPSLLQQPVSQRLPDGPRLGCISTDVAGEGELLWITVGRRLKGICAQGRQQVSTISRLQPTAIIQRTDNTFKKPNDISWASIKGPER